MSNANRLRNFTLGALETAPSPVSEPQVEVGQPKRSATDPVCGMSVDPDEAAAERTHDGTTYWFCGTGCAEAFDADPARYTSGDRASAHDHGHAQP